MREKERHELGSNAEENQREKDDMAQESQESKSLENEDGCRASSYEEEKPKRPNTLDLRPSAPYAAPLDSDVEEGGKDIEGDDKELDLRPSAPYATPLDSDVEEGDEVTEDLDKVLSASNATLSENRVQTEEVDEEEKKSDCADALNLETGSDDVAIRGSEYPEISNAILRQMQDLNIDGNNNIHGIRGNLTHVTEDHVALELSFDESDHLVASVSLLNHS